MLCRLYGHRRADYREAKGVITANYVEALTKVVPPRDGSLLSSMGANRTIGVGMITALSHLLEQRSSAVKTAARVAIFGCICARRQLFRKLSFRLTGRPKGGIFHYAGLLQSYKPEIGNGRVRRHRRRSGNASDRTGVVRTSRHRVGFDGKRG